jgi:hypothetical protein
MSSRSWKRIPKSFTLKSFSSLRKTGLKVLSSSEADVFMYSSYINPPNLRLIIITIFLSSPSQICNEPWSICLTQGLIIVVREARMSASNLTPKYAANAANSTSPASVPQTAITVPNAVKHNVYVVPENASN